MFGGVFHQSAAGYTKLLNSMAIHLTHLLCSYKLHKKSPPLRYEEVSTFDITKILLQNQGNYDKLP
jgi:hypothetical protein